MCQKECKNAFLKFKSIANNRQFCHISNVVHKCTINFFFVRVAVDMPLTNSSLLLHTYLSISWNSDCEKWYNICFKFTCRVRALGAFIWITYLACQQRPETKNLGDDMSATSCKTGTSSVFLFLAGAQLAG